jgi:hypothetical protein
MLLSFAFGLVPREAAPRAMAAEETFNTLIWISARVSLGMDIHIVEKKLDHGLRYSRAKNESELILERHHLARSEFTYN